MNEVWKKHPRFMEYYEVSNLGRVRMLEHYDKLGRLYKEHILNARPHKNGKNRKDHYMRISLKRKSDSRYEDILLHRLVAEAFIPNIDNKLQVNHIDEDKTNNRADNLEWCTNKENHNHGTGHLRTTQHPNYIKSRKEISEKMKGIPKSLETRKKISETLKNK